MAVKRTLEVITTRLNALLTIVLLGIIAVDHAAQAGTQDFPSSAAFASATRGSTTIGFNGILPRGVPFEGFNPLIVSGISFSTPIPGVNVNLTAGSFYSPHYYSADLIINSVKPGDNILIISLPTPTHALALDYGGLGFRGHGSATITLSNGHVFFQPTLPAVGNTTFVGFVSTDPITSLTLVATNDDWVVQDLVLAEGCAVNDKNGCNK